MENLDKALNKKAEKMEENPEYVNPSVIWTNS